jgi:hypothetical protein
MYTPWIPQKQLTRALQRNEAFWDGTLEEGPLLWVTVPDAVPGTPPVPPPTDEKQWTDADYQMEKAEDSLARTAYFGDALPVYGPWLGPDQAAAWLGGDLTFSTADNTSWTRPFVKDWAVVPHLRIDPANKWWRAYREILQASVERGRGKWITAYPDLHTGIDGMGAMRGPEELMMDFLTTPDQCRRIMAEMTRLWKEIVDMVSGVVLPAGQGTSNWTMGWSGKRFVCVGQNDFTCLISPAMFDQFCLTDTVACCSHVDRVIYHLDGPGALQHVPRLLEIPTLHCLQWIQGAGKPLPSRWIPLLKRAQDAGKTVQLVYSGAHGGDADYGTEIDALCGSLDPDRLFIYAVVDSAEKAAFIQTRAQEVSSEARKGRR